MIKHWQSQFLNKVKIFLKECYTKLFVTQMTKYRETSAFQFLYIQSMVTISKFSVRTKGKKLHSLTLVIMT